MASARVLHRAPLLVVCTLALAVPASRTGPASLFGLALLILLAGFVGTQRVWFARLYEGGGLAARQIWPMTRSMLGRFLALGLIVAVGCIAFLMLPALIVLRSTHGSRGALVAVNITFALVVDLLLTFVVPALALTTRSVGEAWRIGVVMIRATWPQSAWYALTPGLTLLLVAQALDAGHSSYTTRVVVAFTAAALALWFKGAIVAFYLRENTTERRAPA